MSHKKTKRDCCREENVMEEEVKVLKVCKRMVTFAHKEAESTFIH